MQVVGDNDSAEPSPREGQLLAALEVGVDHGEARSAANVVEPGRVAIDGKHVVTARQEQTGVATAPAGNVEYRRARRDQRGEANDPG